MVRGPQFATQAVEVRPVAGHRGMFPSIQPDFRPCKNSYSPAGIRRSSTG